jgi:hypothetical protein
MTIMSRSGEHFEVGLVEEGGVDHGLDLVLFDFDESRHLQALHEVDSLPQLLLFEHLEVLGQRRRVVLAYLLHQFCRFLVGGPRLPD